jgi:hypothetical protein
VETAVERAVEERLCRIAPPPPADRRAALMAFFDLPTRLPVKDGRPADEIIGYGPEGLPS